MTMMSLFKTIIVIMVFYSFAITLLVYSMPADTLNYVTSFSDITGSINLESVGTEVQDSITRQTNIPVIDIGALVFYSGNILIDLLLNFAYAIPEMFAIILNGIMLLLNLDTDIVSTVELFTVVLITVLYFIGIIQLLMGARTGRLFT